MSETKVFLFSVMNLCLLFSVLGMGAARLAREFFFARSSTIKREADAAAQLFTEARLKAARGAEGIASLTQDIEARMRALEGLAEAEARRAIEDAKRHAARIRENAARQAEGSRLAAAAEVRGELLALAFERARLILKERIAGDAKRAALERGASEFSELIADAGGAA